MKVKENIFFICCIIVLVFIFSYSYMRWEGKHSVSPVKFKTSSLTIDHVKISAMIADSPLLRETGLSGKNELADNEGMLFVFTEPFEYGFWMKDMKFPLEILWFDEHQTLVEVSPDLLPETYPEVFAPKSKVLYALETHTGFVEKNNIKIGDKFEFLKK
jgi:uncharacterized membrane protein (UPF0127 family)